MQEQRRLKAKPPVSKYQGRLLRREKQENQVPPRSQQRALAVTPVSIPAHTPVTVNNPRDGRRVADNVVFVYFQRWAGEPTILLSEEENEPLLRLPVIFRWPNRFERCSLGWFVKKIGETMAGRITQGMSNCQSFPPSSCNFCPKDLILHARGTSAWAVSELDTGECERWSCRVDINQGNKERRLFTTQWCGISKIDPLSIRLLHRKVILLAITTLKQVYEHRFDASLDAFAERLKAHPD